MDERRPRQRTTRVPEGRGERIARLAGLFAAIAGESALEALRRIAGAGERDASLLLTRASARRLADTLADLRGAAMKLGQLLSLQGHELGREWKRRLAEFDFEPLAAASIGQVHAAHARDGRDLALKLQYPGV